MPSSSRHAANKSFRNIVQRHFVWKPVSVFFWSNLFSNIHWETTWLLTIKAFITNKIREVTSKILHHCYPVNCNIINYKKDINMPFFILSFFFSNCEETLSRSLWEYKYACLFWVNLQNILLFFQNSTYIPVNLLHKNKTLQLLRPSLCHI